MEKWQFFGADGEVMGTLPRSQWYFGSWRQIKRGKIVFPGHQCQIKELPSGNWCAPLIHDTGKTLIIDTDRAVEADALGFDANREIGSKVVEEARRWIEAAGVRGEIEFSIKANRNGSYARYSGWAVKGQREVVQIVREIEAQLESQWQIQVWSPILDRIGIYYLVDTYSEYRLVDTPAYSGKLVEKFMTNKHKGQTWSLSAVLEFVELCREDLGLKAELPIQVIHGDHTIDFARLVEIAGGAR